MKLFAWPIFVYFQNAISWAFSPTMRILEICPDRLSCNVSTECDTNHIRFNSLYNQPIWRRFELKEEYADCLLLCRHCRCLFWKSIGHPCIENNELDHSCLYQPYLNQSCSGPGLSSPRLVNSGAISNNRGGRDHVQSSVEDRRDRLPSVVDRFNHDSSDRAGVSVAALSRNFDNRSRNVELGFHANSSYRDILRERRSDNIENNNNNDGNRNLGGNLIHGRPVRRRGEDLVPKHVTISPQAFLKFFSLWASMRNFSYRWLLNDCDQSHRAPYLTYEVWTNINKSVITPSGHNRYCIGNRSAACGYAIIMSLVKKNTGRKERHEGYIRLLKGQSLW